MWLLPGSEGLTSRQVAPTVIFSPFLWVLTPCCGGLLGFSLYRFYTLCSPQRRTKFSKREIWSLEMISCPQWRQPVNIFRQSYLFLIFLNPLIPVKKFIAVLIWASTNYSVLAKCSWLPVFVQLAKNGFYRWMFIIDLLTGNTNFFVFWKKKRNSILLISRSMLQKLLLYFEFC